MQDNTDPKATRVLKYQLAGKLPLPIGSTILNIEHLPGGIFLWALVPGNTTKTEDRYFVAVKTGMDLPDGINDCRFVKSLITSTLCPAHGISIKVTHIFEASAHVAAKMMKDDTLAAEWWKSADDGEKA